MVKTKALLPFALLLPFTFAYRLGTGDVWDIRKEQPTIWIDVDPALIGQIFEDPELTKDTDDLVGVAEEEQVSEVLRRIAADYNAVATSFLHLQFIPGQLVGGERAYPEDMVYDAAYAQTRTISLMLADPSGLTSGGDALAEGEGGKLNHCRIRLPVATFSSASALQRVLTHELMHCMDSGHQHEDTACIMSYGAGDDVLSLSSEEKMLLTHAYPLDPSFGKEEATFGLSCSPKAK